MKANMPRILELCPEQLRYRMPTGPWHTYSASEVESVTLSKRSMVARTRLNGMPLQRQQTIYGVLVTFTDDEQLYIDTVGALQFGKSTEQLYLLLKQMYDSA